VEGTPGNDAAADPPRGAGPHPAPAPPTAPPAAPPVAPPTAPPATLPPALATGLLDRHLAGLDGLRAVAAFLVVFVHAGFVRSGGLGVLVFFVLSGFLITWLLLKEHDRTDRVSIPRFYARRALRIFPAFQAYWVLVLLLSLARAKPIDWPQAAASFFYVNNYFQAISGDPDTWLSHTWSLGVEEQFYLLWPMLFVGLSKDLRRMARFLVATILVVWAWRAIGRFGLGIWEGWAYEAFDMRADHLAIGCLLAVALRAGLVPRLWAALCAWPATALVTIALIAGSAWLGYRYDEPYRDSVGFIADPLLTAVLIVQAIAFRSSPVLGWMNLRPVRYLGTISYSIYLYQQLVVWSAMKLLADLPLPVQVAGVTAAVVVPAALSYRFVERPFLRIKARYEVG